MVDALLGLVEPAGRLAETFPARLSDVAADPWFPGDGRQVHYREGVFVGYRHAVSAEQPPLFAFGHGLGYGSTQWSRARLDRNVVAAGESLTVTLDIRNTGGRRTSDVVQVYLHDLSGVVLRPRRELVGFARVGLDPGVEVAVSVMIPGERLAFWDTRSGTWQVPSGRMEFELGRSSQAIEATLDVEVTGGVGASAEPPEVAAIAASDADFARRLGRTPPSPAPHRPFTRESTVGDLAVTAIGRVMSWGMQRIVGGSESAEDPVTREMMRRALDEMPLRGLVQLSGGRVSWKAMDAVLALANAFRGGYRGR